MKAIGKKVEQKKSTFKAKRRPKYLRPTGGMRGQLIRGYVERMSEAAFELFWDELRGLLFRKAGLYALYRKHKLHYVGMSENLYVRILNHRRDRHGGKWDNFSAYVIHRFRYIKDLEAIVLRLGERNGNKVRGKFPHEYDFKRSLGRAIREERRNLDRMFYGR